MSARYAPLPNNDDTDRELNAAFDGDDDEDDENAPLNNVRHVRQDSTVATPAPASSAYFANANSSSGAYDFERDYDVPPPGSPPGPSEFALPNDFGNSNGVLPSSPVRATHPTPRQSRPSFFRRVVGAVLPTHYARIPTEDASEVRARVVGGGTQNDGVFANVTAKPQPAQVIHTAEGDVRLVPEETQKEAPPSYQSAQADAVPPYWETTVVAPAVPGEPGTDMIIEDLPSGSVWVFLINVCISFSFNFIGFLFTFLLHTSHAGKYGSRAGLGLTLIQYGFYSRKLPVEYGDDDNIEPSAPIETGVSSGGSAPDPSPTDDIQLDVVSPRDWLAFFFMTVGWFLFLTSCVGYWRVKRWESSIRASAAAPQPPQPLTPEQIAQDREMRRNLEAVFGISFDEEEESDARRNQPLHRIQYDEHGRAVVIPSQAALDEARLERDLRAAGLF
ncbi:hypothetical protein AAF712_008218 [Marasmius tenuissimus]|uniref:Metal homeostatis protein BSD2 n=1 Tax=Marasmius tenuissimus TaxID=585030 RepID=A0ABR2ZT13_9AGAR|nr:hypothetical protein PM082_016256 [Marasmius tenuissimus]